MKSGRGYQGNKGVSSKADRAAKGGQNAQPQRAGSPGKHFTKTAKRVHPKNALMGNGMSVRGGIRL